MKYISVFWREIFMLFKCWHCGKVGVVKLRVLHPIFYVVIQTLSSLIYYAFLAE